MNEANSDPTDFYRLCLEREGDDLTVCLWKQEAEVQQGFYRHYQSFTTVSHQDVRRFSTFVMSPSPLTIPVALPRFTTVK